MLGNIEVNDLFLCIFRCQAVQNMGLATVIIFAGMIVDKYGYLMLEMFFLGCLFGMIVKILNFKFHISW